jgi:Ca2+-binding RTX toxin-like protein
MLGGEGKDRIGTEGFSLAETGLARIEGGGGNDVLIAENLDGAELVGEAGNDNLCVFSGTTAALADGGSGSDKLFGSAEDRNSVTTINSLAECLAFQ